MCCFLDSLSHRVWQLKKTALYINPKCFFCHAKATDIIHKNKPTTQDEIYDIHNILSVCEICKSKHDKCLR